MKREIMSNDKKFKVKQPKKNEAIVKTSIGDVKVRAVTIIDVFEDELILDCLNIVLDMLGKYEGEDVMKYIFSAAPIAARQVIFKCSNINNKYKESLESEITLIENIDLLTSIFELTINDKKRALEVIERSGKVYDSIKELYTKNEHIFDGIGGITKEDEKPKFEVPLDINQILKKYEER